MGAVRPELTSLPKHSSGEKAGEASENEIWPGEHYDVDKFSFSA